jgi:hypothetical protein
MGIVDELKAQAREIERELESRIDDLEKIHSAIDPDDIEVTIEKKPEFVLENSIDRLLSQLKYVSDQMQKSSQTQLERSLANTYIQSQINACRRYSNLKKAIETKRWQQELLGKQIASEDNNKIDLLIREDKSLDGSLEMGRGILSAAHDVRVSMAYQDAKIKSTASKITKFAESLPGINYLMKRISYRKKVNGAVLGLAVGACICIIIYKIY